MVSMTSRGARNEITLLTSQDLMEVFVELEPVRQETEEEEEHGKPEEHEACHNGRRVPDLPSTLAHEIVQRQTAAGVKRARKGRYRRFSELAE